MFVLSIIAALIVAVVVIVRIEIQNNRLLKTVTSPNRGTGTERDFPSSQCLFSKGMCVSKGIGNRSIKLIEV